MRFNLLISSSFGNMNVTQLCCFNGVQPFYLLINVYVDWIAVKYVLTFTGESPYPGKSTQQVANLLQTGYRMPKPRHLSKELWVVYDLETRVGNERQIYWCRIHDHFPVTPLWASVGKSSLAKGQHSNGCVMRSEDYWTIKRFVNYTHDLRKMLIYSMENKPENKSPCRVIISHFHERGVSLCNKITWRQSNLPIMCRP